MINEPMLAVVRICSTQRIRLRVQISNKLSWICLAYSTCEFRAHAQWPTLFLAHNVLGSGVCHPHTPDPQENA